MFGKFAAGIKRAGKGSHGSKYKIDVQVTQLENLPAYVKKVRVVWSRSAKVQMTDFKDARGSVALFKQTLTQVTTVYKDKSGKPEEKEYEFKIQAQGKSATDAPITIGKAPLDLAKYCTDQTSSQNAMLPITFKVGGTTTGYLKMTITSVYIADADDGVTEVSGMTGLTSEQGIRAEQDLDGFADDDHAVLSKRASRGRRNGGSTLGPGEGPGTSSAGKPAAGDAPLRPGKKALPPTAEEDGSDGDEAPAAKPKAPARKPLPLSNIEEEDDEDDNLASKRSARPPPRKAPPKKWEDDDDVSPISSDASESEKLKPGKQPASREPEESFDDMRASLLSSKKTKPAAAAPPKADSGRSGAGPSAPPPPASKAKPAPPPRKIDDDEDEDALRSDLFSAKPRAAPPPPVRTAAAAAAVPAAKSKAKPSPQPPVDDDDEDEDDRPSTSAPAAAKRPAPKPSAPAAWGHAEDEPEPKAGLSTAARAPLSGKSGGGSVELDQLRQRVVQLEAQLVDEQAAKTDLDKKLKKYADKITDLEDQLAEADIAELFTQMSAMEAQYKAEIKDLMDKHLAEVGELEERHRAEMEALQQQLDEGGTGRGARTRGGVSAAELQQREAEVAARTTKLEAQQAAAEAKLAEANKMIDDSLLVATKRQQENKALQEEIAKLKKQLADTSDWDTQHAVAAATAASAGAAGARGFDDEELDELRAKVSELQGENRRLQAMVSHAGAGRCLGSLGLSCLKAGRFPCASSSGIGRVARKGPVRWRAVGCGLCVLHMPVHCTRQNSGSPCLLLSWQPTRLCTECTSVAAAAPSHYKSFSCQQPYAAPSRT